MLKSLFTWKEKENYGKAKNSSLSLERQNGIQWLNPENVALDDEHGPSKEAVHF